MDIHMKGTGVLYGTPYGMTMPRSDGGVAVLAAPARHPFHAALVTTRPHQWIKNALVFAAVAAAGVLGADDVLPRVTVAFAAFCLLASGTYAINDVHDAAEDRRHPRKRYRPVAAGELAPRTAVALGIGLLCSGLALCAAVAPLLALTGAAYVALTLSYTLVWRRVPVLDTVAIAGGFVLRAVAGGTAAPVHLSWWFILVISCAAVFVATGKRLAELQRTRASRAPRRRVLELYTPRRLRSILAGSGAGALFAYCVWAFSLPMIDGVAWRPLSIPPFVICLLRYQQLALGGEGEAPEELLLSDRIVRLGGLTWLVLFALGVNAAT
jgi:decaprenyl-phosphate phosphoribosyltransferase